MSPDVEPYEHEDDGVVFPEACVHVTPARYGPGDPEPPERCLAQTVEGSAFCVDHIEAGEWEPWE